MVGRGLRRAQSSRSVQAAGRTAILPLQPTFVDVTRRGSDGRRLFAETELWRPSWPDIARGNRGGARNLALPGAVASFEKFNRIFLYMPVQRRSLKDQVKQQILERIL